MDAQTFFDNFATVAEGPGGIQRLRDLVLDLAVSGLLALQEKDDEPASDLLRTIASDKERLIAEGLAKPTRSYSPRQPEGPSLPPGWSWTYMPCLGFVDPRNAVDPDVVTGFVPMPLVPTDTREPARFEERKWSEISKGYTHIADGDVAVAKITPCFQNGKSAVFAGLPSGVGAATTELFVLRPTPRGVNPRYVHLVLRSPRFLKGGVPEMTGTAGQQRLPREYFTDTAIPLPPRAEQARIVTKVDELMELCNELQLRQAALHRATTRFRGSALHALTEAQTGDDLRHAWARVSASWPALVDNAEGIPAFRAAILDLAFRGRLVTQDRGDGSAAVLLPADHSPINDPPYAIPSTWEWARFDEVAESRLGKMLDKAKNVGPLRPYLRNANVQWFRFDLGDIHELRLEDKDYEAHSLRTDDLVICEGGEPGRAAVCDAAVEGMVFQKALHRARPRQGVDVWYLAYLLESTAANGRLARYFTGATIKHLTGRSLGTFPVPLPPADEQKRIVAVIESAFRKCDDIDQRLRVRDDIAERWAASALRKVGLAR